MQCTYLSVWGVYVCLSVLSIFLSACWFGQNDFKTVIYKQHKISKKRHLYIPEEALVPKCCVVCILLFWHHSGQHGRRPANQHIDPPIPCIELKLWKWIAVIGDLPCYLSVCLSVNTKWLDCCTLPGRLQLCPSLSPLPTRQSSCLSVSLSVCLHNKR